VVVFWWSLQAYKLQRNTSVKKMGNTKIYDQQPHALAILYSVTSKFHQKRLIIMAYKWIQTKHTGLRYREHPYRKHGIQKDRFYQYRHMADGKRVEDSFGWQSKGWTEAKCIIEIAKIQQAKVTGIGPATLKDQRQIATDERKQIEREKSTVADAWESYLKIASAKKAWTREESVYRLWIAPTIGKRRLSSVAAIHLERIKKLMADEGLSPRTIQYALAITRQIFNHAKKHDLFNSDNPVGKVSMPKFDNRRMRFLTHDEADQLLKELLTRSKQTHDMTFLSLYTGMRAGEVFSLTWADVDTSAGIITLRNTKNSKTRFAFMTDKVKSMFSSKPTDNSNNLVFPDRNGKQIVQISEAFNRAVAKLGFNEGVTDRRFKVTFHTCRHTFASWLVESGADLYAVKELLGHSDFKMTSRYAHLGQNTLQAAVRKMESMIRAASAGDSIIHLQSGKS